MVGVHDVAVNYTSFFAQVESNLCHLTNESGSITRGRAVLSIVRGCDIGPTLDIITDIGDIKLASCLLV